MKTEAKRTLPRKEAKAIEKRERERERERRENLGLSGKLVWSLLCFLFPVRDRTKTKEKRERAPAKIENERAKIYKGHIVFLSFFSMQNYTKVLYFTLFYFV
jgi:hypothetical protein